MSVGVGPAPLLDSSVGAPTRPRWDVVGYLTLWLVLLFSIPATQVVGPLGGIGTPALIVASITPVWWLAGHLVPGMGGAAGAQPMRAALIAWLWYQLATIVIAHTRPLTALEQSASVREAFVLLSMVGVALVVADGVSSIERLETLLRRLVWGGAAMATVGIAQFVTKLPIVVAVPGLSAERMREGLAARSIFNRPYGTALHPIEFSVVLGALLPLSLYLTIEGEPGSPQRRWAAVASGAIALAIPLSLSRSGFVTIAASLAVLALGWSWRRRAQALVVGLVAVPIMWLAIPGLVGTIRNLFTGIDRDPSIQARLDRLPRIMEVVDERPWFGLGAGTFSVDDYFLVDSQFWVSMMETGIVGIVLTGGLIVLGAVMAISSRHHRLATPRTAHLGYAIAAGLTGLTMSMFTFDALFYHILRGCLFLLLGASGALWRLTRDGTLEQ